MQMRLSEFLKWIWRGKSARRAFLNMEVAQRIELEGLVLDLGCKGRTSYQEVLKKSGCARLVLMDIYPGEGVGFCGDVISMPVKDAVFDAAICFNVLEHVYDYRAALNEMRRVLKSNGLLYGYVPFICNVHPDPSDYWRFTADCLQKCLSEAGFSVECVSPHGGVFISCFDLSSFVVRKLPPLRLLLAIIALWSEALLARVRPSYQEKYPVGYFFIGRSLS